MKCCLRGKSEFSGRQVGQIFLQLGISPKIGEIGKTMRNDAPTMIKKYAPDSEKVRPVLWSFVGELAKEFVLTTVSGGFISFHYFSSYLC